jgi:hypothetical protein
MSKQFEFRTAAGVVNPCDCDQCRRAKTSDDDYTPPNSYADDLAQLHAAASTQPPPTDAEALASFTARYQADAFRAVAEESREIAADVEASPPFRTLSNAELDEYAAPDGYALALAKEEKEG